MVRVERRFIQEHQRNKCPQRKLNCEFCQGRVKACEMNFHLEKCEMFPINCPNGCVLTGKTGTRQFNRKDVPLHLSDECPLQILKCPYWNYGCREEMKRKFIPEHQRDKCPQRLLNCTFCKKGVKACEMDLHLVKCEMFPINCPNGCVLTGETGTRQIKRKDIPSHLFDECPLQILKCPYWESGCREEMERRFIPKHQRDKCPQRLLNCTFCKKGVKACEMDPHLVECEMFPINCPNGCVLTGETGTRQIMRKDVPIHLSDECPLQILKCPYWNYGCREEMKRKFIPEHQRDKCPQRLLECTFCKKGVKACEMDLHLVKCEMFPINCPNGCVITGETKTRQINRKYVPLHLSVECPLQILKCPYWESGCREEMERRFIPEHQRDKCPQRLLNCTFCKKGVKACEMDPHLVECEMFPINCPNGCVLTGETGTRQIKIKDIPSHLFDECPLQILKCPYWESGCREEMERKELELHQKDSVHIHFKLAMSEVQDIKQRQIESDNKVLFLEKANATKDLEIKRLKETTDLEIKRLKETTDLEIKRLKTRDLEIKRLKETRDFEVEQLKKTISILVIETCKTEWKINGVRNKVTNNKISAKYSSSYRDPYSYSYSYWDSSPYRGTYSYCDPYSYSDLFYVGQYKCQCKILWSDSTSKDKIDCFISIVKGKFDAALQWPFVYRVKFELHNQTMNGDNHTWSHEVSKEDLQRFPECFQRPTGVRNKAFGVASFISKKVLLAEKYCKHDSISLSISVKQLPAFY